MSNFSGQYQSNDYVTIKYNENGIQQWVKTYGAAGIVDISKAIAVNNIGDIYVTGGAYNPLLTNYDCVTIKYNTNGTQLWVATYNGPANAGDGATSIAIDKFGFIYVAGATIGFDGRENFFTIKYNSNGDTIWSNIYIGTDYSPYWGTSIDFVTSIAVDDSCYVYVTGPCGIPGPPRNKDYITIKYKPNGDSVWVRRYSNIGDDYPVKVLVDNSYNVYVTGFSIDGSGSAEDYATIKYDKNGNQKWISRYNGPGNAADYVYSAVLDENNNIYVTGRSYGGPTTWDDYATVKYDTSGNQLWAQRFNGQANSYDYGYDISIDDSANVYVTGSSININNDYEFATIKYNTNGALQWVKSYPGGGHYIAVDSLRNVYVSGTNNIAGTGMDIITIKYSQLVGVNNISNEIPKSFRLYQNYPNPFNPVTKIRFQLPTDINVTFKIYDLIGREVATLLNNEFKPAGIHTVEWDASNNVSCVYFYRLIAGSYMDTKRMILLK